MDNDDRKFSNNSNQPGSESVNRPESNVEIKRIPNWHLLIVVSTVVLGGILLAASAYLYLTQYKPMMQRESAPAPIQSPSPAQGFARPTFEVLPPSTWKTYKDEQYKFEIRYPAEGWGLTTKVSTPILSDDTKYKEAKYVNLYSQRVFEGVESTVFTIAVFDKPLDASLTQWLSTAIPNLSKVAKGNIHKAFVRAYAGEEGIISYAESQKGSMTISELGAVAIEGSLFYTAYITKSGHRYVYAIELHLPFHEKGAEPSDSTYEELFNLMVSTFRFTD